LTESFNVSNNIWTTLAPLPQATVFAGSAVYNGLLYCIGGADANLGKVLSKVQIYQP
jgi:N-acetylneuraminic acid mutarotase